MQVRECKHCGSAKFTCELIEGRMIFVDLPPVSCNTTLTETLVPVITSKIRNPSAVAFRIFSL